MDEEAEECECEEGAPAWLATFADLMSLLMCFFVLLLSFSEMDIQKYKQVAGSMERAFGIQRSVESDEIPKGTTVISQEFSPGRPEPTPILEMRQSTTDETQQNLRTNTLPTVNVDELAAQVSAALAAEIEAQVLDVIPGETGVLIRVREKDSFPSGSARLQGDFEAVLDKLTVVLNAVEARVIVEGHTDDVPIDTPDYPSNWVLSSARAASVVHYLTENRLNDPSRVSIRARGEYLPIAPNDSAANRAKNRRVEINISLAPEDY